MPSCPRRCARPTRPSRSTRDRSRRGPWPRGCASRPAAWVTRPRHLRRLCRDRPPQSHRALDRRGAARVAAGAGRAGLESRQRLAGGGPGKPGQLRVLRPALLRTGAARGRARRLAQGGACQSRRERHRAQAGRDAGRPVSNRGSHRDVLAGLRPGRGPRSQARGGARS